jgi:hypothetical protein
MKNAVNLAVNATSWEHHEDRTPAPAFLVSGIFFLKLIHILVKLPYDNDTSTYEDNIIYETY